MDSNRQDSSLDRRPSVELELAVDLPPAETSVEHDFEWIRRFSPDGVDCDVVVDGDDDVYCRHDDDGDDDVCVSVSTWTRHYQ